MSTTADVATELAAMKRIATALDALDQPTRQRALAWLWARYNLDRYPDSADPYPPPDQPHA